MAAPARDLELERVKRFSRVMDHFLVDPLLGLFLPGVGDLIGALLGFYVIALAARRKVSPVVISRMLLNLTLDAAMGALPVVGDAVDFVFHANEKNVALLETRGARGGRASWRDWLVVVGSALLLVLVLGAVVYAVGRLVGWLFSL